MDGKDGTGYLLIGSRLSSNTYVLTVINKNVIRFNFIIIQVLYMIQFIDYAIDKQDTSHQETSIQHPTNQNKFNNCVIFNIFFFLTFFYKFLKYSYVILGIFPI